MKENAEKKEREEKEKKYTLFSNVRYIYKTLYEVKPAMRFGMYGSIFFYLAGRVVGTVTLAAAVASITEKGRTGHYLMVMAVMLAVFRGIYGNGSP